MKTVTCECGHEESGSTEKDAMTKMESHMRNDHPERASDIKKMMKRAEKTVKDAVPVM
jgi:predicted small metal-binding protein